MTSWIQKEIEAAIEADKIKIIDPKLGYVANLELADPSAKQRINDEGYDAHVAGVPLEKNPHFRDGEYGWWRNGWLTADDNLAKIG